MCFTAELVNRISVCPQPEIYLDALSAALCVILRFALVRASRWSIQIIQVQKENRNPYFFCPSCYSNPPSQALVLVCTRFSSHSTSQTSSKVIRCRCFVSIAVSLLVRSQRSLCYHKIVVYNFKNVATQPVRKCPDCFKPMTIKSGARGYFLGTNTIDERKCTVLIS